MRLDNGYHRNPYKGYTDNGGKYRTVFWPVTKGHDPEMAALKSISCSGATGGTGINGHTAVYINMHAWFGLRGLAFQRQVRGMYARGCYIRILYSFMTKRVYHRLTDGTGGRMQARRTIFANHPGGHSPVSTATSRTSWPPATWAVTTAPGWCGPGRTTSPRTARTSTR